MKKKVSTSLFLVDN